MTSVSIVIPTYNSEKTIEICLESIVNQSYKNIEIIVVDRFSKDGTIEIAKSYGAKVYQFVDSDIELSEKVAERVTNLGLRIWGGIIK